MPHRGIRTGSLIGIGLAVALISGILFATRAQAAGGIFSNYSSRARILCPTTINVGPDRALWFINSPTPNCNPGYTNSIGRITTAGVISKYSETGINSPSDIVAGPDGALWFTNTNPPSIGRMTTGGVVTNDYTDPSIVDPSVIVAGPDGALWFINNGMGTTGVDTIGRITTDGVVSSFSDPSIHIPEDLAVGPDGALWFTDFSNGTIDRLTTGGVLTTFSAADSENNTVQPFAMTAGPDDSMWYTETICSIDQPDCAAVICRIDMSGVSQLVSGGLTDSIGDITTGPDGDLWFTNVGTAARMTTGGVVTSYSDAAAPGGSNDVVTGPDGAVWFTDFNDNLIGRVTVPPTLNLSPNSGPPGTAVVASGGGFPPGESVNVIYRTGLATPNPLKIPLCTATVRRNGTFTCNATIPSDTTAGATGTHTIKVKGTSPFTQTTTIFTLT